MNKAIGGQLRALSIIALAFLSTSALHASISVTMSPSAAGPQPVGTVITWTATVHDSAASAHEYQFSVGPTAGPAAIVQDFSDSNTFRWAAGEAGTDGVFAMTEGSDQVSVVAQDISNNTASGAAAQAFVVTSRVVNGIEAVTGTANPLVALFSARKCITGNFIRIRFHPVGSSVSQTTNANPCSETNTANFYIAGMYPSTKYQMHHETLTADGTVIHTGTPLTFTTGAIPSGVTFPATSVVIPAVPPSSTTAPVLLHGYILGPVPTATDLSGNVLWYYDQQVDLTRTERGGNMFVINSHKNTLYDNTLREIDLAGNVTLETNANRINEQLALMTGPNGKPRSRIIQFDHEARRLSTGNIAVKASSERLVTDAAQCGIDSGGKANTCDVIGDQVLILNPNLQIIWAWDAFDFLDISRPANLGEVCDQGDDGCPVFFLAPTANDWLHGNAIQLTADGNLLVSFRNQDWVIKINYANGTGDGGVLWRMGFQGDFTFLNPPLSPLCTTPDEQQEYAWFTHQHDAALQFGAEKVFSTFDNGNLRTHRCDTGGNSRGYVLTVDEINRTVTPLLIQDLGNYSHGLGTAEVVPGTSNYHFNNGQIAGPRSKSLEITPLGSTAFEMDSADVYTYRSFRMQDLYTPAP